MSKRRTHPDQLDLFLHSGAVMLTNDVLDALRARDLERTMRSLERLRAEEADGRALGDLQVLCDALRDWPYPASDSAETARSVRKLEETVQPAARRAMGGCSADFMRPFWRDLATSVRQYPYDPAWPEAHCAALLLRAGEDRAAEEAAASLPDAEHQPNALHWMAVARYRAQGLEASRPLLFRLAMVAPERLLAAMNDIGDATLQKDWEDFWAECAWLDPQDQTAACWFPAWSLLQHPGMRLTGDQVALSGTAASEAFALVTRLLELETRGYSRALVSARSRLRDLEPNLFECFMARRRSSAF